MATGAAERIHTCANGVTVSYGACQTEQNNHGFVQLDAPSCPQRAIIVSSWDVAKIIGEILIEDFEKEW